MSDRCGLCCSEQKILCRFEKRLAFFGERGIGTVSTELIDGGRMRRKGILKSGCWSGLRLRHVIKRVDIEFSTFRQRTVELSISLRA
jgi:hypothetical protein